MGLDVDLNVPLSDHCDEVGTSSHVPAVPQVQAAPLVVPIDVDSLEEDVVLSSPRAFAAVMIVVHLFNTVGGLFMWTYFKLLSENLFIVVF